MNDTEPPKQLVLVVGAGASQEAGLPIGSELTKSVARALNIQHVDGHQRSSGDEVVEAALQMQSIEVDPHRLKPNQFIESAWRVRDGMPQAPSIDNYIDVHRDKPLIELCGKLAIVRCILAAEAESAMRVRGSSAPNKIALGTMVDTWFNSFFQLLAANCPTDGLAAQFSKVAIVCFNYDRCIEHYLWASLQNYYHLSPSDSARLVGRLTIYHPYGQVGRLPWEESGTAIEFGGVPTGLELLRLSREIRTFTEGTDSSSSQIVKIRQTLSTAHRLVFMGFAFHDLNLELLFPRGSESAAPRSTPVYATAYKISEANRIAIRRDLRARTGIDPSQIALRETLHCRSLLPEYSRELTLV